MRDPWQLLFRIVIPLLYAVLVFLLGLALAGTAPWDQLLIHIAVLVIPIALYSWAVRRILARTAIKYPARARWALLGLHAVPLALLVLALVWYLNMVAVARTEGIQLNTCLRQVAPKTVAFGFGGVCHVELVDPHLTDQDIPQLAACFAGITSRVSLVARGTQITPAGEAHWNQLCPAIRLEVQALPSTGP